MLGLSALSVPPEEDDWRSRMCFASYTVDGRAGARNHTTTRTVTTSAAAIFQWRWRIFR